MGKINNYGYWTDFDEEPYPNYGSRHTTGHGVQARIAYPRQMTPIRGADERYELPRTVGISPSDNINVRELFAVQTTSGQDQSMVNYIIDWLNTNFPGGAVDMHQDSRGNLFVTKRKPRNVGFYPAFAAHTDTVHRLYNMDLQIASYGHWLRAFVVDAAGFHDAGIGGDDKCGIIAALEMLVRLPYCKVAFFRDEEVGCQGSSVADLSWFDDCRFIIQVDRRNNCDIITHGAGTKLCSDAFVEVIESICEPYGLKPTNGASTDVVALTSRNVGISTINCSAGYYHPHTKGEQVHMLDLYNTIEFIMHLTDQLGDTRWEHTVEKKAYQTWGWNQARQSYPRSTGGPQKEGPPIVPVQEREPETAVGYDAWLPLDVCNQCKAVLNYSQNTKYKVPVCAQCFEKAAMLMPAGAGNELKRTLKGLETKHQRHAKAQPELEHDKGGLGRNPCRICSKEIEDNIVGDRCKTCRYCVTCHLLLPDEVLWSAQIAHRRCGSDNKEKGLICQP